MRHEILIMNISSIEHQRFLKAHKAFKQQFIAGFEVGYAPSSHSIDNLFTLSLSNKRNYGALCALSSREGIALNRDEIDYIELARRCCNLDSHGFYENSVFLYLYRNFTNDIEEIIRLNANLCIFVLIEEAYQEFNNKFKDGEFQDAVISYLLNDIDYDFYCFVSNEGYLTAMTLAPQISLSHLNERDVVNKFGEGSKSKAISYIKNTHRNYNENIEKQKYLELRKDLFCNMSYERVAQITLSILAENYDSLGDYNLYAYCQDYFVDGGKRYDIDSLDQVAVNLFEDCAVIYRGIDSVFEHDCFRCSSSLKKIIFQIEDECKYFIEHLNEGYIIDKYEFTEDEIEENLEIKRMGLIWKESIEFCKTKIGMD